MHGCLLVAHCHCGRGLGAPQGPQKPEGSRCSEMHSQPYLRFFFRCAGLSGWSPIIFYGVRAQLFFSLIIRAQLFFSKNFRARLFSSILYTPPPPPPPWISNSQCLRPDEWCCLTSKCNEELHRLTSRETIECIKDLTRKYYKYDMIQTMVFLFTLNTWTLDFMYI